MTSHVTQKKAEAAKLVPRFCITMRLFRAAALYFALVFGIGFMLGPIRVLWGIPRVGERNAELIELAFMLIAVFLSARWTVHRFSVASVRLSTLAMGIIALGLLLIAEMLAVLWMRGLSISEYVQNRDLVSGTAYLLMLGMFALMPWFVAPRMVDRAATDSSASPLMLASRSRSRNDYY